jgi:hypothetical protein
VAKNDVVAELRPSQVEMAMPEPKFLSRQWLAAISRDGDDRCFGGANEAKRFSAHLHLAALEIRVSHLDRPRNHLSRDENDALGSQPARQFHRVGGSVRGIEGHLHDARAVAKVNEYQTPQIAPAMNPPAQSHGRAHVAESE